MYSSVRTVTVGPRDAPVVRQVWFMPVMVTLWGLLKEEGHV